MICERSIALADARYRAPPLGCESILQSAVESPVADFLSFAGMVRLLWSLTPDAMNRAPCHASALSDRS